VWRNWAGNVTARPRRVAAPASVDELAAVVRKAAEDGLSV
jgi:FAD/FMN-containing dehydrogenase